MPVYEDPLLAAYFGTPDTGPSLGSPGTSPMDPTQGMPPEEVASQVSIDPDPGAFGSFLRWLDRPGQVVRNLLTGNVGGAFSQLGDFVLDPIDAVLPFDVIPEISDPDDYVEGSDLINLDENAPGWQRFLADVGIGILTDPLSYTGIGLIKGAATKGSAAAARHAKTAQALAEGIQKKSKVGLDEAMELATQRLGEATQTRPSIVAGIPFGPQKTIVGPDALQNTITGPVARALDTASKTALGEPGAQGLKDAIAGLGSFGRRTMGWLAPTGHVLDSAKTARGTGEMGRQADIAQIQDIFRDAGEKVDQAVADALDNFAYDETGRVTGLLSESGDMQEQISKAAAIAGVDEGEVTSRVQQVLGLGKKQWQDLLAEGGAKATAEAPGGIEDYFPVAYRGRRLDEGGKLVEDPADLEDALTEAALGIRQLDDLDTPAAMQTRKLLTPQERLEWLTKQQDLAAKAGRDPVRMIRSASQRLLQRAGAQGRQIEKGVMARKLLGDTANWADDGTKQAINSLMDTIKKDDPDTYQVLANIFKGGEPRGAFSKMLSNYNTRIFKPAVTMGVGLPRVAFNVRNQLSAIWQVASAQGVKAAMQQGKRVLPQLYGAFTDGLKRLGLNVGRRGAFAKQLSTIDDAITKSGGSLTEFKRLLVEADSELAEAAERGVLDAFVSTENMVQSGMSLTKSKRRMRNFLEWPAEITRGLEARMRLGSFLDLRKAGKSADEAAKLTEDAFLDYSYLIGGPQYATMRNILPFFAFAAQSIPQQAKLLARRPEVGVGLAQALDVTPSDTPVDPFIGEQTSLPLGTDAEGNPQYATTLGLPIDALNMIPNLAASPLEAGRDVERGIIGSMHPLLKGAYSLVSRRDPFFGGQFGSYAKEPITGEESEFGRAYQIARQLGAIAPIDPHVQSVSRAFDDRRSAGAKIANFLTGINIASSDPDRAAIRLMQRELEMNPRAKQYRTFYGDDPRVQALKDALNEAKRRAREKKEAAEQGL